MNFTITTERRDRTPSSLTVYPEPVHHGRNDALDGLLPGRRLKEIAPDFSVRTSLSCEAKGGPKCVPSDNRKGSRVGADGNQT